MNFETAIRAIDFLYEHSSLSESVGVGFYGGEPLLEIELLKNVLIMQKKYFMVRI